MQRKQFVLVAMAFSMLAGLLVAAPVSAQTLVETEAPTMQNVAWYSFDVGKVDDDFDTEVTISSKDIATKFQLFTADELDYWAMPDEEGWFGEASYQEPDEDSDENVRGVVWSGNLVPGTYYVRHSAGTSELGISGKAVSGLNPINQTPSEADVVVVEEVDTADADAVEQPVAVDVEEFVVPTVGQWIETNGRDVIMLSFDVGRLDDELPTVTINMNTEPFDGAGQFQVFTAGDAPSAWEVPDEEDWVGFSNDTDSDDRYYMNNNRWSGELVAGSYVIRVEPQGAHRVQIGVSGKAVSY